VGFYDGSIASSLDALCGLFGFGSFQRITFNDLVAQYVDDVPEPAGSFSEPAGSSPESAGSSPETPGSSPAPPGSSPERLD
jgi:hypothetical protein